ncbi:MAG: hypothetical protein M1168_01160 [Candidatus Marsarchaeota archaeon]|nr:hypothetical protein [Candidatus Marsarchaeota archaeon]MCL5094575.1 hypothetical protein [Candidatus Marsarchaeota archaeon]
METYNIDKKNKNNKRNRIIRGAAGIAIIGSLSFSLYGCAAYIPFQNGSYININPNQLTIGNFETGANFSVLLNDLNQMKYNQKINVNLKDKTQIIPISILKLKNNYMVTNKISNEKYYITPSQLGNLVYYKFLRQDPRTKVEVAMLRNNTSSIN